MYQNSKRQGHMPHLWIIFLAALALTTSYLIEVYTACHLPAEGASLLEPTFSLPGGYYNRDTELGITAPNPKVNVIFTVDGSVPTRSTGEIYTQPIHLSATTPTTAATPPGQQTPGPLSAGGLVLAGLAARYLTVRRTTRRTY